MSISLESRAQPILTLLGKINSIVRRIAREKWLLFGIHGESSFIYSHLAFLFERRGGAQIVNGKFQRSVNFWTFPMGIKRDWYQSNERIILALLSKSCTEVDVQFESDKVTVSGINKGTVVIYERDNLLRLSRTLSIVIYRPEIICWNKSKQSKSWLGLTKLENLLAL